MIARSLTDDLDVNSSLTRGQSHRALAGVRPAVARADRIADGCRRTLLRTDAAAVLTAGAVTARDPGTRVYTQQSEQAATVTVATGRIADGCRRTLLGTDASAVLTAGAVTARDPSTCV